MSEKISLDSSEDKANRFYIIKLNFKQIYSQPLQIFCNKTPYI